VRDQIVSVLEAIGSECDAIYVVDDGCPEGTADYVEASISDPRLRVLRHATNQGVGAAVLTGYRAAIHDGAGIIVKLDGDGQMAPSLIPTLIAPILAGDADYVKGNRFFDPESVRGMPPFRLVGNALLSFMTKFSSGYWDIFDPTNGFTAIDARVAARLPLDKLNRGYFFESDILFRLNTLRAVVQDVPMRASYGREQSNLHVHRIVVTFLISHAVNALKRICYCYFVRDFSIASIEILLGPILIAFGTTVGVVHWLASERYGVLASSGTVMLAALPIVVGMELVLAFLAYDIGNVPRRPLIRYRNARGDRL